ncbi:MULTISPECIES: phosphoribosylformylglycinamidine synthase subunit PurL [unclassified Tolypothrix]|uniref:phosphoribosylformylglycinamidine synthase subunit PurL n=1 Tax=unclassified Tolypothrix TaxID=2649714 RepID=UPI0005EAB305|nr:MULTISPECIES: phosphoribosylformylglycinamidine synthase subunit PurL [unclassified Tolypothrix]BAY91542.1 phosphoribosylformylglycinamidine synthase II [Microchaete diplosiphon NIES-3275]EKF05381.1 phosphoribosylformylglycinamidine synthase II [Tolypothrix sp. PCC 7601]MBE9087141.1 phosphoribosylformylglycinamidine synthase subunit PurL [Tolypothrix sp. LEGE 11397]UYD25572.1 phosphoribosylformylglycinamidine synthase subunit PurL [Tolypothrix sp. PCC 7712]UYD32186.1 phosphoribosylformylgly
MTAQSSAPFSPQEIAAEGLKPEEYEEIVRRLGRHPNKAELGMFGVMWSEHCCYKNSRPLLKQFPTTGPRILVGPGENAGVVDLGDGLQLAFKIESHNHPSAVEPFQGAATGVGGILRDIFTMGARPIALLNSLRFGSLEDGKTQRLFQGVVAGISHYGNCLVGNETFIWRDRNGVNFDKIGNFVESRLRGNVTTLELDDAIAVETLSLDPDTHASCWQRVRRIFKRRTQTLVTIRTNLGRTLTVTPDHPMLVQSKGQWDICTAQSLKVGDEIPILTALPESDRAEEILPLDLISTLNPEDGTGKDVYVELPATWQPTAEIRTALRLLEPSAVNRHQYLKDGRLPLGYFLALESVLKISRSEVRLFRRGKANYMRAVITPDAGFARLLGYYLSEGCVSQNGNTYKIIFTFALHESEYIEDVVSALKDLGLRPCVEKRSSTIAVYATSWLFGHILKNVWQCGAGASNKAFPSFVFTWPSHLQREALKGLLRGDGSLTTKTHGSHAKISFATTSHKLFEQTLMLIQNQGAIPYIYQRPASVGEIEGRKHTRLPLWQLEVTNFAGLTALANVFSQARTAELATALARYDGTKYSFPRFRQPANTLAVVKITSIETKNVDECNVYDVEVDNTHLFVTTSGIITHNCVGVPTVGGEVYFDPAYSGNPLVNVMALGLMETPEIVKSGASGIGNPVLYVGSTTGRDGMGGASFASAELSDESLDDRPAVQVGDPFLEKSLIEACLEAFKTGAVVAAQDMGAAGITCSTSEMAAKGGVGIELDLDKIPVRELGMVPYEYLLSESQERMLFVAHKGREQELIDIFHRWGLQAVVAGNVIAEPIVRILFEGGIAAEIPADALAENTPLYHRELLAEPPEYARQAWEWQADSLPPCNTTGIEIQGSLQSWNDILLTLLDTPTIASKSWVYRQYDHQVQNNTVIFPGGADAAVVRLRPLEPPGKTGSKTGVAATVDCNPRYVYLDPYEGAKAVVAEAARNLSCVGAEPLAVTDNLNFGSPEKPIGYWQLAEACRGLAEGCRELATPVTGGNVSLYNETLDSQGNPQPIYPTPVVGMVGLIPDISKICGQAWQAAGDAIYLLGSLPQSNDNLGASEYLVAIHNTIAGKPPKVDFESERRIQKVCREGIRAGWIRSAHDCAEGGLAVALAESCIAGNLGAQITLELPANNSTRWDTLLFGEGGGQILVSVGSEQQEIWESYLQEHLNQQWQKLGIVVNSEMGLGVLTSDNQTLIKGSINDMTNRYSQAIAKRLAVHITTPS